MRALVRARKTRRIPPIRSTEQFPGGVVFGFVASDLLSTPGTAAPWQLRQVAAVCQGAFPGFLSVR
jgi:hypothetical protein